MVKNNSGFTQFKRITFLSFKRTLNNRYIYIFCAILCSINIVTALIIPNVIGDHKIDMPHMFDGVAITSFSLITMYSSLCAEANVNIEERVFIYTRPVTRIQYISSKITSSFAIGFCFSLLVFLIWIIGNQISPTKDMFIQQFDKDSIDVEWWFFLDLIILSSFGSICGCMFGTTFKNRLTSTVVMVTVLIVFLGLTLSGLDEKKIAILKYETFAPAVFIPLSFIAFVIGLNILKKENIKI